MKRRKVARGVPTGLPIFIAVGIALTAQVSGVEGTGLQPIDKGSAGIQSCPAVCTPARGLSC